MASEMRRAAKALVEAHPLVVKSDFPPGEASARLNQLALPGATIEASPSGVVIHTTMGDHFVGTWKAAEGLHTLEGESLPQARTQRVLKAFGVALTLLIAATAWTFLAGLETSLKVSAGLFTLFAIFAFPYVIVGLASQRSGREAAIARSLQRALTREIS